ncbi:lysophospholipid acyltransferase 5-like [Diadema antillarum]|uniref:lysophospholipid acyltransferase 5-like n=1 Tax=Diadema antillarum TaxID=105358 RepID=UPI003A86A20D
MAHLGMLKMMEINPISTFFEELSVIVGVGVVDLRFYVTILLCYPLGLFARRYVISSAPNTQHLFYAAAGLSMAYFNYGLDCLHYVITIVVNFLLLQLIGGTRLSVFISFVYNMGYLMICYLNKKEDFHALSWDTPQCVLCLKVIGMAFDVYDGHKPNKEKLNRDQKENCVPRIPSLLEVSGFSLFFAGFMSGPQFSMRQYLLLTNCQLLPKSEMKNPSNLVPAARCFFLGLIYLFMTIVCKPVFSNKYLLSNEFKNASPVYRVYAVLLWGVFDRSTYITAWLMAEGSCILTGLGYNGVDKHGRSRWDHCENINVSKYETSLTFRELISSYNVKTNHWARRHVYQRLRFLGVRPLSQMLTLLFLAFWHGPYTGYFHAFIFEFFELFSEEALMQFWKMLGLGPVVVGKTSYIIAFPLLRILMLLGFAYPFISFQFLLWPTYNEVYASIFFIGHIVFVILPLIFLLVIKPLHLAYTSLRAPSSKSK